MDFVHATLRSALIFIPVITAIAFVINALVMLYVWQRFSVGRLSVLYVKYKFQMRLMGLQAIGILVSGGMLSFGAYFLLNFYKG
jgi:hypothetical protein